MASTINGYEGTGRSLSIKLIQQLRESCKASLAANTTVDAEIATTSSKKAVNKAPPKARTLREIKLETPIRYSPGDKIEKWLNSLLCLDATVVSKSLSSQGCPHPSKCELYYVSRDTLFSYHPASELFLQRMMALYVASHYKNQPNDLQLMSDAPAHHLFVLLPPVKDDESTLPEPLAVLQVALEGSISKQSILDGLSRGTRTGGDLIPWLISEQVCIGLVGLYEYANFGIVPRKQVCLAFWCTGSSHCNTPGLYQCQRSYLFFHSRRLTVCAYRWVMVREPWKRSMHSTAVNISTLTKHHRQR